MMNTLRISVVALLSSLTVVTASAQLSDQQIVDNAYPPELIISDAHAPSRFSTFEAADLNRNGERLLVALYTNRSQAGISVIDRSGRVLSHPDLRSLKGSTGELELIDLDGDGVPEIIAHLYSGHGLPVPDSWVFAWRNHQLSLISPTAHVGHLDITPLSQIVALDLEGNGKLSLVAFPGVKRDNNGNVVSDGEGRIYKLVDGRYAETSQRFVYADSFFRHGGEPKEVVRHFAAAAGKSTLRIERMGNAQDDENSLHILLNGAALPHPSDSDHANRMTTVPVDLKADNTLSVTMAGEKGTGVWIIVDSPASLPVVQAVVPVINCIKRDEDGLAKVSFGYVNPNSSAVTIAVGVGNHLTPDPADRHQPTTFNPGKHRGVFTVSIPKGGTISWTVNGTTVTVEPQTRLQCDEGNDSN
jgi:hypothetical protein